MIERGIIMERKYSCYFMSDGRVLFIDNKDVDEAIDAEKELLVIDTHCGVSFAIGADKEINAYDADPEYIYNMYNRDYTNHEDSVSDPSRFSKIIFTKGERIYMKSGYEATDYFQGIGAFAEYEDYKPNDLNSGKVSISNDAPCKTVDMKKTINYFENHVKDGKEKLECMSGYLIEGLKWSGTAYKKF
jgi:hypothetical protein